MRSTSMFLRRSRLAGALVVALVVAAAAVAGVAQSANGAVTTLATFTTPGSHVWTVPTGVTAVTFDVYGARGGSVLSSSGGIVNVVSIGGPGGEAKGRFDVHAGEKFEIVVGGQGATATGSVYGMGGANGGANGGYYGGGGGGGSDVRIGGRGNACAVAKTCGYENRIVVGGGGGGGGNGATLDGGQGGGVTAPGGGGTQQSGGIC